MNKLFSQENESKCILSNIVLEFRPGIILNAILEHKSLVLRSLSNTPTVVLERFNELLSGKQILTLNEDINNTFTCEKDKELSNFIDFRVFATSPSNSPLRLSDAILSRFTVISVNEYKEEEQKIVLDSYINMNRLDFNETDIEKIIKVTEGFCDKKFAFSQIIKCIEVCSLISKENRNSNQSKNICIAIYRVFGGILPDKSKIKLFKKINEIFQSFDPNVLRYNEEPISIVEEEKYHGIKSNISSLFIKASNARKPEMNVAFTPVFNEMVDILHLGFLIHIPVILEGSPGQGKQLAINYIARALGYETVTIVISESTTIEDLLGNYSAFDDNGETHIDLVETMLVKLLKSESEASNKIIVFQNMNCASPAVLNVLDDIFSSDRDKMTLKDGSVISKGKLNIVGVMNSHEGSNARVKLPSSLITSSIYNNVKNPGSKEINSIIAKLFKKTEFSNDSSSFANKFLKMKKLCSDSNTTTIFTVNDIAKYIILRNITFDKFNESIVSQMVFSYQFTDDSMIQQVNETLNLKSTMINPVFTFNVANRELFISQFNESNKGLILPLFSDVNSEDCESMINCLTIPQKQCLIFLACSYLSNRVCLIQGETASGKSHIIRLFAKMLGKKLYTFQMNSDTRITMLSGQSAFVNSLSQVYIDQLNESLEILKLNDVLSNWINENMHDQEKWSQKKFQELLIQINNVIKDKQIIQQELEAISKAADVIIRIKDPAKHFHHVNSSFINAMLKGDWVLIDGIESAPPSIAGKLSSLCGDDPELNLYECGHNFYFTRRNANETQIIHKDFRLFVTYNPVNKNGQNRLDHSFINKCFTFSLPPIDSSIEYSAQVLHGSFSKMIFNQKASIELASRMANLHSYAKHESERENGNFAGDLQFTGRTLKFITKVFENQSNITEPTIVESICLVIKYFYWNSHVCNGLKNQFEENTIDKLSDETQNELVTKLYDLQNNIKARNSSVLNELLKIQKFVTEKSGTIEHFSFSTLIEKFKITQIKDLPFLNRHLSDTISIIGRNCDFLSLSNNIFMERFSCLKSIRRIFDNIIMIMKNFEIEQFTLKLIDPSLFKCKELVDHLSQFHLLCELLNDVDYSFTSSVPVIISNPNLLKLLKIIIELTNNRIYINFINLIKALQQFRHFIPYIDKIFPYFQFKNKKYEMICYIIPLLSKLYETETNFNIELDNKAFNFEFNGENHNVNIIIRDQENLYLHEGTIASIISKINYRFKEAKTSDLKIKKFNYVFCLMCINMCLDKDNPYYNVSKDERSLMNNFLTSKYINMDQISCLSILYEDLHSTEMVAKLWSIAFFLERENMNIIISYLHPLESTVLKVFKKLKKMANQDNIKIIIEFTKYLHGFGRPESILWKLLAKISTISKNSSISDYKSQISQTNDEIQRLQKEDIIDLELWKEEKLRYITILEKHLIELEDKKNERAEIDEEQRISKQYLDLIEKLNLFASTSKSHDVIIDRMIKHIYSIYKDKKYLNQGIYEEIKEKIDKFVEIIHENKINSCTNDIPWPVYASPKRITDEPTANQKMLEILIWYSQVIQQIDKILEDHDPMKTIIELSKDQEMISICSLMIDIAMNTNNNRIKDSVNNVDIIFSTLNAIFFYKIETSGCHDLIPNITSTLNEYVKREKLDESEYQWAHDNAGLYPTDFAILVPKLKPNDFIFLFTHKTGQRDECFSDGPITSSLKNIDGFHEQLVKIMSNKFSSVKDCVISIGKCAFRSFVDCKIPVPDDEQQLINALKNKINEFDANRIIINSIVNLIDFSNKIDSIADEKFSYDDFHFIKDGPLYDKNLVSLFPSLGYWIVRNHQCYQKLRSLSLTETLDDFQLPLWLHFLRIMSSQNCIKFEAKSSTNMSKVISQTAEEAVLSAVIEKPPGNYQWINLLNDNIPEEIKDQKLQMIYSFLNYISEDNKCIDDFLDNIKKNSIIEFINELLSSYFNSNIDDVFNMGLEDNDKIASFIKDPVLCIQAQFQKAVNEKCQNYLESIEIAKFNEDCLMICEKLPISMENFISSIQKSKKEIMGHEKQVKENIRRKELNRIIDTIKNYKRLSDILITLDKEIQLNDESYQHYVQELIFLKEELNIYDVFDNNIIFSTIMYHSEPSNHDLMMNIYSTELSNNNYEPVKNLRKQIKFQKNQVCCHYFS